MENVWDGHYKREKSRLNYPDENLVRMLTRITPPNKKALDFGSGSGRHIHLLLDNGYDVSASDSSHESVSQLNLLDLHIPIFHTENLPYPFKKNTYGLIVSWGVFHYNARPLAKSMLDELYKSMCNDGYFLGSIRAASDTHLKLKDGKVNLADLKGGYAETYTLLELQELLKIFTSYEIGYMERTPLGRLDERICHWFFLARK